MENQYYNSLRSLMFILLLFVFGITHAQTIKYSEPDRNELKQTNFDIIGKSGSNVLIFKNTRTSSYISVYDENMALVENVDMPYIPQKMIEYDLLPFNDYTYLFYQYQQRNVIHLMVVKLGSDGKNITSPVELDTTHIGYNASKRVYSVIANEDKTRIMSFKINSRNEKTFIFNTQLYDANLGAIHASQLILPMSDKFDFLTDFYLDNDGNLVFGRGRRRGSEENISQFYLVAKHPQSDTFSISELKFEGITLDEVKLRIDNYNNRYLFTAFYYKGRKGNIEGIANSVYDKAQYEWVVRNVIPLGDELRADARGDNNLKAAFNDYFIKQILIRRDGGFVLNAESMYQTSRGSNPFNRWDMFGNPWMMGSPMGWGGWGMMGPGGWGMPWRGGMNNTTRFHADNVIVLAFDKEGQMELSNIIRKNQFDDENDAMVSYQTINTGNAIHYLYNDYDKREMVLAYQSIDSDGKVTRNPTMRNIDRKYSFMPRFSRQVASRTIILPCLVRNYLCFARIDF